MASPKTPEKKNLVKSIYLYLFTAIGLGMFLIGTFFLAQYATKKLFLPKYYLDWQETRCDYISPQPLMPQDSNSKGSSQDYEQQKKDCLEKLEEERKYKEVIDLSSNVTMIVLGAAVFVFHYRKTRDNI